MDLLTWMTGKPFVYIWKFIVLSTDLQANERPLYFRTNDTAENLQTTLCLWLTVCVVTTVLFYIRSRYISGSQNSYFDVTFLQWSCHRFTLLFTTQANNSLDMCSVGTKGRRYQILWPSFPSHDQGIRTSEHLAYMCKVNDFKMTRCEFTPSLHTFILYRCYYCYHYCHYCLNAYRVFARDPCVIVIR